MKNIKKSLIAVAVLATFPIQGFCIQSAYTESSTEDIDVKGAYDTGIYSEAESLSFSGKEISIDITPGQDWRKGPVGVYARGPGKINLGSNITENISINVTDNAKAEDVSIGLWAKQGGKLEVQAKQLNIKVNSENGWAYGVYSQGVSDSSTSLLIDADINIEASGANGGHALVAMSNASLVINGNLRATGRNALTARGDAIVKINESGQYTTVLEGDINFNFDLQSSGTKADADVLVNLTGKDSKWTGIVRYSHAGIPPTEDLSKITGFKLILADGAQWNTKEPNNYEDTGTGSGSKAIAVNALTLNEGVINILENTNQVVEAENLKGSGGTINTIATTDGSTVSAG